MEAELTQLNARYKSTLSAVSREARAFWCGVYIESGFALVLEALSAVCFGVALESELGC